MSGSPALEKLMAAGPYGLPQREKRAVLTERTRELTRHHYERCDLYRNLLDRLFGGSKALRFDTLEDAPFLPVSLFKTQELRSVNPEAVIKILTSSGTTGQAVSRIHLDAGTAQLQSRTLVKIMQHFLGVQRRPMVFLDHAGVVRDRRSSSARAAGILGMLPFGRQPFYALRDDMSLDVDGLQEYLQKTRERFSATRRTAPSSPIAMRPIRSETTSSVSRHAVPLPIAMMLRRCLRISSSSLFLASSRLFCG